ncbi:uncharacterized protein DS421_16g535480 [Arachis hypogaea]|nr:uncharacterized protein DS421_16g535480 [Arachis hypogaea]
MDIMPYQSTELDGILCYSLNGYECKILFLLLNLAQMFEVRSDLSCSMYFV